MYGNLINPNISIYSPTVRIVCTAQMRMYTVWRLYSLNSLVEQNRYLPSERDFTYLHLYFTHATTSAYLFQGKYKTHIGLTRLLVLLLAVYCRT